MRAVKRLLGATLAISMLFLYAPVYAANAAEERDVLLRLTDSISHSSRDFTSYQEGELYFKRYNQWTHIFATNDDITVRHERQAKWGSNFYIDGSQAKTDKKTIVDIRFKAELDSYSAPQKPQAQLRFYHNGGRFLAETEPFVPEEGDGTHTVRFVLNPDTRRIYTSLDGNAYKAEYLGGVSDDTYGGEMRIYPMALAAEPGAEDALTPLETNLTYIFDDFYIYQTSGDMPSETESLDTEITDAQSEEFDMLRERWRSYLTGGGSDGNDAMVDRKVYEINDSARYHWDRMYKYDGRTALFSDVTDLGASAHIRADYNYLLIMAKAYATPGGSLYGNKELADDIISALDWMYENEYNENTQTYDNWWEWEIGVPEVLNNIIVLMYDDLSDERVKKYEKAVNHFSPDPRWCCLPGRLNSTAANRLSMCLVVGLRGIIIKDPERVALASRSLDVVFDYVTSGDGFYKDGSFIQHDRHPYNGGYGLGMILDLSTLIYLFGDSAYEVTTEGRTHIYDWIYKGYVPLMYHGIITDAVTGRSGSRSYNSTLSAVSMLKSVLMLAHMADAENAAKLKSIAKAWISENTLGNLYTDYNTDILTIKMMGEVMGDASVAPAEVQEGNYQYPGMDRVAHNRKDYSFVISMYSDRIYNFESILGENLKGWHTADGMTYLYNSDTAQYTDAFWPTVNPNMLSGTTVANTIFKDSEGAGSLSGESQVGGASLEGMYGNACMSLKAYGGDLTAKKSWFMFDDEIVALGSDINSSDGAKTVIENRKLNPFGNNELTVDGSAAVTEMGTEEKLNGVRWMHLEGNTTGADIGYYLFDGADVMALRENRTGSWRDINLSNARDYNSKSYMSMWIDHGGKADGGTYAYAILPGMSKRETEKYADNPAVEIIRNDAAAQSVRNRVLGITGAIFWTDTEQTAGGITCNSRAAVMMREYDDELVFGISDPTQSNTGAVEITYDGSAGDIVSCDNSITVLSVYPKVRLLVSVSGTMGQTQTVRLKKTGKNYINPYVLIDNNITAENNDASCYTVRGRGSVEFRAWTAPASSVSGGSDALTVTQSVKSIYKDHFQLASSISIPHDSPTVINIRYKVNAAMENTSETAAMSLYIPGVSAWKVGTGSIELSRHSDEYKEFLALIDPLSGKIYYSADGITFSETDFDGDMAEDAGEVRLYTIASPDGSNQTDGDGAETLKSPVTWTFDRIEITPYTDDGRHVLFSSFNSAETDGGIEYTAEAVNVSAFPQSAVIVTAAYDEGGLLRGLDIRKLENILYGEKIAQTGLIKTDTEQKLTVKSFIWSGLDTMISYDRGI